MQLEIIIEALRQRCAVFGNRVAGAAQFKILPEAAALAVPCAYVIPLDDNPSESASQNSVRQPLTDSFAVIVVVSNTADEKGQGSAASLHQMRKTLWAALLGWRPEEDYEGIAYEGGQLLQLDRARAWYQYDFGAAMEIGPEDGWQDTALAGLPHFDGLNVTVDAIDPADPNIANPGPDGRTEASFSAPQTGALD